MTEKRLGEIINIKHGYAFDGEHIVSDDNGIVLVTPGNFKIGGGFKEEKCKFFTGEIPEDYILNNGDYIVTMTDLSKDIDTLGYSAKIPDNPKRIYLHNQRIGLLNFKDNDVCKDYIYYVMQTNDYQRSIANTSSGATVHHTSPTKIYEYTFKLPKYSIQKKIADLLGSYDSLIENNQKQIKLLEEAAQRLYKEWFVDFRFPGYGDTKFIDGIPDGWRKQKISNFGEIKTGKTPSTTKESYYGGHIPFVKIPDMHNRIYPIVTETTLTSEGANTQKNQFIPKNSIMVSCIGTVGLVNISIELCQTNQQINSIMPNDEKDLYYIYSTMKRLKTLLEGVGSNGATMTNVNKTKFGNLEVLYPNYDLRDKYFNNCKVIFEKIFSLSVGIEKLTQARDRLLPKLMSGEIEV